MNPINPSTGLPQLATPASDIEVELAYALNEVRSATVRRDAAVG